MHLQSNTDIHGRVSVVIPCFNAAPYIDQAVESVLAQTYNNIDVIVVDDGSTDGSGNIADKYVPRIVVIHQANAGEGPARNSGVTRCRGEYVAFLDADDWWDPEFLSTRVAEINSAEQVGAVIGSAHFVEKGETVLTPFCENGIYSPGNASVWLMKKIGGIPIHSALVRRSCLNGDSVFSPAKLGCDYEFWLELSLRHSIIVSDKVLSFYRQHAVQVTRGRGGVGHWRLHSIAHRFWRQHHEQLGLAEPPGMASFEYILGIAGQLYRERRYREFIAVYARMAIFSRVSMRQLQRLIFMGAAALFGPRVFLRASWCGFEVMGIGRMIQAKMKSRT